MNWLRLCDLIGLTNLTDSQIEDYIQISAASAKHEQRRFHKLSVEALEARDLLAAPMEADVGVATQERVEQTIMAYAVQIDATLQKLEALQTEALQKLGASQTEALQKLGDFTARLGRVGDQFTSTLGSASDQLESTLMRLDRILCDVHNRLNRLEEQQKPRPVEGHELDRGQNYSQGPPGSRTPDYPHGPSGPRPPDYGDIPEE